MESVVVNSNTENQSAQRIRRRRQSRWDSVDDRRLVSPAPANTTAVSEPNGNVPAIPVDQTIETTTQKAIDLIFRTPQRILQETKIIADLKEFVKKQKFNLQVVPFGSATYGFGGASTDFNISLLNNEGL